MTSIIAAASMTWAFIRLSPMLKRLAFYLIAVAALIMSEVAGAEQPARLDERISHAGQLFLRGRVREAIRQQQEIISAIPALSDKAILQRNLLEMCAAAEDWHCVAQALQDLLPIVQSDPGFSRFKIDIATYGVKLALWRRNDSDIELFLRQSSALLTSNMFDNPTATAELNFAMHDYYVRRHDLKSAEKCLSDGIMGLLMSQDAGPHQLASLSVQLLQSLLRAGDIVNAMTLADMLWPIMPKLESVDSVTTARYLMLVAQAAAYTGKHSKSAEFAPYASHAIKQLDIDDDSKLYDLSVANSLGSIALILDGRAAEAGDLHARHPLQPRKQAILDRGEFQTAQELFFAATDVLVTAAQQKADLRWRRLLEKQPRWKADSLEAADLESYRNFALGMLAATAMGGSEARRLLELAAEERIDNFDAVLRTNFEGFPLPSLMDELIVGAGMSVVNGTDARHDMNLLLRGSEVLGRSFRHELVDVAVLLGAQPDDSARRNAQSYALLLRQKRDFELHHIEKLLARNGTLEPKLELFRDYSGMAADLIRSKDHLVEDGRIVPARGLPSLDDLQKSMPAGSAFVAYFPTVNGNGKLCVTRDRVQDAITPRLPDFAQHARLIEFATTAAYPPNPDLDAQFPVSSAVYLYQYYFAGLEECLKPGTSVTMALPHDYAMATPFGALLAEAPPRTTAGYDLAKAHWLIRDLSFSRVVSARQYLATLPYLDRAPAPRPYLGIGDPKLNKPQAALLASSDAVREAAAAPNGLADLAELPETSEELKAVAKLFGAPADIMIRGDATEVALRAKPLGEYDVLHFATHGLVKADLPDLTESALVLTPSGGDDKSTDGVLTATEISRLSLNARLVVLSACNTARYEMARAGPGVQDLQAAFTVAGVPTLLASLWPVDSTAARDLVTGFVDAWRSPNTRGAADALARATRTFLDTADAMHQHPRFWAPFVVLGNGDVRGTPVGLH